LESQELLGAEANAKKILGALLGSSASGRYYADAEILGFVVLDVEIIVVNLFREVPSFKPDCDEQKIHIQRL